MFIRLDIPEIAAQENALRCAADRFNETEIKYKKTMDEMSNAWQGSSGKSFAEAARRMEAGYATYKSALEQIINDVTAMQITMTNQDILTAQSIDAKKTG